MYTLGYYIEVFTDVSVSGGVYSIVHLSEVEFVCFTARQPTHALYQPYRMANNQKVSESQGFVRAGVLVKFNQYLVLNDFMFLL